MQPLTVAVAYAGDKGLTTVIGEFAAMPWHAFNAANAIAAVLTLAVLIVGLRYVVRGGGGAALHILTEANQVLVGRVSALEAQARKDSLLISDLKTRTDVATQLQPIITWTTEHEHRDQERFERTLLVLERIAERLGPDLSLPN